MTLGLGLSCGSRRRRTLWVLTALPSQSAWTVPRGGMLFVPIMPRPQGRKSPIFWGSLGSARLNFVMGTSRMARLWGGGHDQFPFMNAFQAAELGRQLTQLARWPSQQNHLQT